VAAWESVSVGASVADCESVVVGLVVSVGLAVSVGVAVSVGLAVSVGVAVDRSHSEEVKTLVSKVTEPLRARARPSTVVPVVIEMDVKARIVPTKVVFVPRVAELPTCQ